jgi:putative (di)nucleoside polyphosphate hydrolase
MNGRLPKGPLPTSCGTLIVNPAGQLLLCHVTDTARWDIPKGMRDPGESTLEAAIRELREEAGIAFAPERYRELGLFDYRPDKRLHLYLVRASLELTSLEHLACTSFFPHQATGEPTPEVDAYRWAARTEVAALCWPRMAQRLLALEW